MSFQRGGGGGRRRARWGRFEAAAARALIQPRAPCSLFYSLAGDLTELQQLTAANPEARKLFVDYLAKYEPLIKALLQPLDLATPLLLRFNKGLAPHADKLRDVLKLETFADVIKTGVQNAAAGACESGRRERRRAACTGACWGRFEAAAAGG